jgi:YD repeat-containing protein
MKHSFLLLSLSIMTLFCYGQTNDDNSLFSNSYDKKVVKDNNIDTICVVIDFSNKQTERFYAFDKLGNLTYTITFDETGNKTSESTLKYNSQGKLISKKDKEEMIDDSTSYFYNISGQLERAVTKNNANQTTTVTYTYDKQKLVEETRKENTGQLVTKYKYDTRDRLIELTTLTLQGNDTTGTVAVHKSISYDSKGNKSSEEATFFTKDTVVYQYNENNKLVVVQKGKDTERYYYNSRGLLTQKEITKFLIDRPMTYTEKYRYVVRQ